MKDKAFIDTNILVYLYSEDELDKKEKSKSVFDKYSCVTSTQVLNELSNVFIRKFKISPVVVSKVIDEVCLNCEVSEIGVGTIKVALKIVERYVYSYYDSLIISSSLDNECKFLISEDMQNGQIINNSLVIRNIFVDMIPDEK
jgi:predicted nucleic acid-binding protein